MWWKFHCFLCQQWYSLLIGLLNHPTICTLTSFALLSHLVLIHNHVPCVIRCRTRSRSLWQQFVSAHCKFQPGWQWPLMEKLMHEIFFAPHARKMFHGSNDFSSGNAKQMFPVLFLEWYIFFGFFSFCLFHPGRPFQAMTCLIGYWSFVSRFTLTNCQRILKQIWASCCRRTKTFRTSARLQRVGFGSWKNQCPDVIS